MTVGEARLAEVADDQVGARAGGDLVAPGAAEDDVVAVAALDDVARTPALLGRVDLADEAVLEADDAHVAEQDVGARAGGDVVGAHAADDDVVAVATLDDVARAVIRIGRGELDTRAGLEERVAVVAEDHVVAAEGGDRVGPGAADDDVVAAAGIDRVVVAEGRVEALGPLDEAEGIEGDAAVIAEHDVRLGVVLAGIDAVGTETAQHDVGTGAGADDVARAAVAVALDDGPDAELEAHAAVVAEDDVVALAGRDGVAARTADDEVVAVAGIDPVVAGIRGVGRDEGDAHAGLEHGVAMIAEDDVAAAERGDHVAARSADDDVFAAADTDLVVAAEADVEALGALHAAEGVERDLAVVAEDDVGIGVVGEGVDLARVDRVGAEAADDQIGAGARRDDVARAAVAVAENTRPDAELERHETVVAEHDVGAAGGRDGVAARTADDEVVAGACRDPVVAAVGGVGRGELDAHALLEHRVAAVADDHVAAAERGDDVAAGAADDDVVAAADVDGVVAAEARIEAFGPLHDAAGVEGHVAVVAEHEVGIRVGRAGVDHVAAEAADHEVGARAGRDGVGRAAVAVARHLDTDSARELHPAVVAEHDVGTGARGDRVGARAAEDEVVAGTRVDLVVAADRRVDGFGERNAALTVEGDLAVVAEDDVAVAVGLAGVDRVGAEATEHQIGARTRGDDVARAAVAVADYVGPHAEFVGERAVVAEDDVAARARGDGVAARAAEHDVVAVADVDPVVAGADRVGRNEGHAHPAVELRRTAVAEDDVAAAERGDDVAADARDDEVVACADIDDVVAAEAEVDALGTLHAPVRLEGHAAVVAEHGVVAAERGDLVGAGAGDDEVVTAAHHDGVVVAEARIEALGPLHAAPRIEEDVAVVAEHDVGIAVAETRVDRVGPETADHEVGARARGDGVAAAAVAVADRLQADSARE
ncbi:hypothetical protein HPGCJGGD_3745 [Methylobacterium haplocladii]|nr:hypothetical protein HPGCJGGD_3745 [Methylobacterium haplocladii]